MWFFPSLSCTLAQQFVKQNSTITFKALKILNSFDQVRHLRHGTSAKLETHLIAGDSLSVNNAQKIKIPTPTMREQAQPYSAVPYWFYH